jgi:hypothetical protein
MNIVGIGGTYIGTLHQYGKNATALEVFLEPHLLEQALLVLLQDWVNYL